MDDDNNATAYEIHDNGGRPFLVKILPANEVHIFKESDNAEKDYPYESLLKMKCDEIWVGESPECAMTAFSGGAGPRFKGNTILLRPSNPSDDKPLVYVHIGRSLRQFEAIAPITSFVSPVGNNDVPYPYAIDTEGNTYLISENAILGPEAKWKDEADDPYDFYYQNRLMSSDLGCIPSRNPPPSKLNAEAWWIGEDRFTMRCAVSPEADYDRLIPSRGDGMFIQYPGQEKIVMTKQMYCDLMHKVAAERHYKPLNSQRYVVNQSC